MYTLKNNELVVSILDPVADEKRLGSRYCTGGYIWQVEDVNKGTLLTGPVFPHEPDTFNGQGMPDMFHRPVGFEGVEVGGEVMCVGVGQVRRTSPMEPFDVRYNPEVVKFLTWDVKTSPDTITMEADHVFRDWAYHLVRTVRLDGRTVHSYTEVRNTGEDELPVRWFAHPFFPITEDLVLCKFSMPVGLADNPGYYLNADGFVTRKAAHDWQRGWYQVVEYEKKGDALTVIEKHPKVGEVITKTDFMPSFLPIWGNAITFSFEPYYERTFFPKESAGWNISYTF